LQNHELTEYGDISREMANRIGKQLQRYESVTDFADILKTKNVTRSYITRGLFQIMLGIESRLCRQVCRPVPYLRLLGMRQGAGSLLRQVSGIPVITKVADFEKILAGFYEGDCLSFATECFRLDVLAADIYRQTMLDKTGIKITDEYRAGVIRNE
jgi:hypothetical protein